MGTPGLFSYVDRMERWGDRTFLVGSKGYRKRPWSYREVRSAILALSREIEGLHIETGDRVILQGPSSPEWVVAFFAVIHRGGVVVPVDAQPGGAGIVGDVGQVYGMPALGRPEARRVRDQPNGGNGTFVPRGGHGVGKVRLGRRGPAGSGLPATLGNLTLSDATQ